MKKIDKDIIYEKYTGFEIADDINYRYSQIEFNYQFLTSHISDFQNKFIIFKVSIPKVQLQVQTKQFQTYALNETHSQYVIQIMYSKILIPKISLQNFDQYVKIEGMSLKPDQLERFKRTFIYKYQLTGRDLIIDSIQCQYKDDIMNPEIIIGDETVKKMFKQNYIIK